MYLHLPWPVLLQTGMLWEMWDGDGDAKKKKLASLMHVIWWCQTWRFGHIIRALGFEKERGWVTWVKLGIRVSGYGSVSETNVKTLRSVSRWKTRQGHKGGGEEENMDKPLLHLGSNSTLKMVKVMREGEILKMCIRLSHTWSQTIPWKCPRMAWHCWIQPLTCSGPNETGTPKSDTPTYILNQPCTSSAPAMGQHAKAVGSPTIFAKVKIHVVTFLTFSNSQRTKKITPVLGWPLAWWTVMKTNQKTNCAFL